MRIKPWSERKPLFRARISSKSRAQIEQPADESREPHPLSNHETLFYDERLDGRCIYCGEYYNSDEHVPSKVFLDKPYPGNLPVVDACATCNTAFSNDESYVASLIECVICGTSNPEQISRTVVKKILARSPALVSMISQSMVDGPDGIITHPDFDRVHRVFIKLAVGHVKFELGEIVDAFDATVICKPFVLMTEEERFEFENPQVPLLAGWPEIGSRAFIETECLFRKDEMPTYSFESSEESQYWWEVQENRYRYWVDSDGTSEVRMVLSEYLAVTVYLL